jgi:outer membrane protein OmpA-like peptidoglycan-associated protein
MKETALILTLLLTFSHLQAQREIKKADRLVHKNEMKQAIVLYHKAYEKKPALETARKLADCYRLINNSIASEVWYAEVLGYSGFDFSSFYFYADVLKQNGKFAKAKSFYLLYGEVVPGQAEMASKLAASCDSALIESVLSGLSLTGDTEPVFKEEFDFTDLKNKEFKANNIYYDLDKCEIRADAAIELDKIILIMKDNENIRVEMRAHADSRGSDEYNFKLSLKRAKSALDYLISNGIEKSRVSALGYGKTQLVNHCKEGAICTEKEHQANRRVEIKLIIEQNIPTKYTENEVKEESNG